MVARLALVPDGKHLDPVAARRDPVQRDVAGPTVGDHELTQPSSDRPTDVRVTFQHPNCVYDDLRRVDGGTGLDCSQEIEQPVEIGQRAGLVAQVRSGLSVGEKLVDHPDDKVRDGVRVRPREP